MISYCLCWVINVLGIFVIFVFWLDRDLKWGMGCGDVVWVSWLMDDLLFVFVGWFVEFGSYMVCGGGG